MPRARYLALLLAGLSACFVDIGGDGSDTGPAATTGSTGSAGSTGSTDATSASPTTSGDSSDATTTTATTTTTASTTTDLTTTTGPPLSTSSTGELTNDPPAVCGDGHVDPGEECDDGNQVDDDTCRNTCLLPSCKDGAHNQNETGIDCGGNCPECLLCDPLAQDCPAGEECIPAPDVFSCVLDASGEEGQFNDPCEFANICDPGLLCVSSEQASSACDQNIGGCCQPFCAFPEQACPNPDQFCKQYFDPTLLAADDPRLKIGICALKM
jgi:cysteine-rich repeat protein